VQVFPSQTFGCIVPLIREIPASTDCSPDECKLNRSASLGPPCARHREYQRSASGDRSALPCAGEESPPWWPIARATPSSAPPDSVRGSWTRL